MTTMTQETRYALERALACMVPLAAAAAGAGVLRDARRHIAAALLGLLWCLPAVLLLQRMNLRMHWWSFAVSDAAGILTMPLELWIGWAALWGAVPSLLFTRLPAVLVVALLLALDVVTMPLMSLLHLQRTWLVGECVALLLVLLPALLLQRLTVARTRVRWRATLQVVAAAGVFLYVPAELVASYTHTVWQSYTQWPDGLRALLVQCGVLLAVPGLSAVQEFASRGGGTPLPYDPPLRLVTTGMYRYVTNPVQLSCALVMLVWALLLRSPWLLAGPALAVVYSVGIARWDEDVDLQQRFGDAWTGYRRSVRAWLPRWRPYSKAEAKLYVARDCSACSTVRRFLEVRTPVSVTFLDAEELPAGSITRMRYVCGDERVEGVHAMARALEHLHLGWAVVGSMLRLPGVRWVLQVLLDVSGFGPMVRTCEWKAARQ